MNNPRLLVSVRSAPEARIAVECGVDLIDIKEPLRGPLGRCDDEIIAAIAREVGNRAPISVALGELREAASPVELPPLDAVRFAKFGLAGAAELSDWRNQLLSVWNLLPTHVAPVAVIYGDNQRAGSPAPQEIISFATQARCKALLIDTFCKDGTTLLDHVPTAQLRTYGQQVKAAGMVFVVGGSLGMKTIRQVAGLGVDYVAVRGAVCKRSRTSEIDPKRIVQIAQVLSHPRSRAPLLKN